MKTIDEYIEMVKVKFSDGQRVVEIPAREPFKFRRNLYKAARRRNLPWRFALTNAGVMVAV